MSLKRALSVGDLDEDDDGEFATVSSRKRTKEKGKAPAPNPSSQPRKKPVLSQADDTNFDGDDQRLMIIRQNETIKALQSEVKELTTRLHFVLSFLGISTDKPPPTTATSAAAVVGPAVVPATATATAARSYAGAVVGKAEPTLSAPLRQAVISAVYTDIQSQVRRAANIVVTGLKPASSVTDSDLVTGLINHELGVNVTVVKSRRLGHQVPGKTQPLLATLQSETQAEAIVYKAKKLRQSVDPSTRQYVYINRDKTPAQASAEYQARCRRRANKAANPHAPVNRPLGASSGVAPPSTTVDIPASTSMSVLAVDFIPQSLSQGLSTTSTTNTNVLASNS
jgi:hypothetical protein